VRYLLCHLAMLPTLEGLARGGLWSFYPILWTFCIVPVLDVVLRNDMSSPHHGGLVLGEATALFSLWSVPFVYTAFLFPVLVGVSQLAFSPLEIVGLVVSTGVVTGSVAVVTGHELVHRSSTWERALGLYLLTLAGNPHFRIEHVEGHHRYVGTPRDPATARFGESIYRFYLRSVPGQLGSAWSIECGRLARHGLRVISLRNRMLQYAAALMVLHLAIWTLMGWRAGLFMVVQCFFGAVVLFDAVNYIEHYGLVRNELGAGRYEPVGPQHSWDAYQKTTNWFLFNLGRHSDHHMNAWRPFLRLHTQMEAPRMPAGYAATILLAWIPPLWFRVMDPRVIAARAGVSRPIPQSEHSRDAR